MCRFDLRADVVKTAGSIDLKSISGEIAGGPVAGSARFDTRGDKTRFSIAANAGSVSLPSLLGSLIAWQRTPSTEMMLGSLAQNASEVWPARGFALGPLGAAGGDITLNAKTLNLGAPFQVGDATLVARVDQAGLSITDLQGNLFGGSFDASGTLTPKGTGAALKLHAELATGKLDQLSQALAGRVLAKGPFTFVVDVAGEGLSPPGLVAGLNGEGALFLDPGALLALSPEPLKRVARDADRSKKLDKDQIDARMGTLHDTLTKGIYAYAATALPFAIKNGTLKLDAATLAGKGAETTINGYVELASLRLDSEWAMRLNGDKNGDMPPVALVFAGALNDAADITPAIDTAPMENFLTVSRMQADVERLETLDVSGRTQPQAGDQAAADNSADVPDDSGEPFTQEPPTPEKLAALKTAVEQRAADRAAEAKRLANQKAAEQKRAADRATEEKRSAEKAAADKLAAEKAAADKLAAEKAAAEKAAAEQAAAEKRAAEKAAAEQAAAEKAAAKKAAAEKRAAEKAAAEKVAAEKRAAEKAARERAAAEKAAAEQAAAEKAAAEKAAAEQAASEKAAAEKAVAEKAAAEKAAAEKLAAERLLLRRLLLRRPLRQTRPPPRTRRRSRGEQRRPEAAPTGGQTEVLPWSQGATGAAPSNAPSAEAQPSRRQPPTDGTRTGAGGGAKTKTEPSAASA